MVQGFKASTRCRWRPLVVTVTITIADTNAFHYLIRLKQRQWLERLQSLDPKHEKAKKKKNRRKQKHGRVSRALKTKSDKKRLAHP